jgi:transcriptional regulator with XRE-family HTH domain
MAWMSGQPYTDRVTAHIRRLRKLRRWSALEVANRTAALGHPVTRGVIASRETGRGSTISVDELVVLAAVFGVEPAELLAEEVKVCATCSGSPPPGYACLTCGESVEGSG